MTRRLALALILAVGAAACLGGNPDCEALPTRIELTLSSDTLEPADPAVCRDRTVTLVLQPEVAGVLHIHGYDEQVPATAVAAGEVIEMTFSASRSGQFPIELHAEDDPTGLNVGIFTVHEP